MNNPLDPLVVEKVPVGKQETAPANPELVIGTPNMSDLERINVSRTVGIDDLKQIKRYEPDINRLVEWAKAKGSKEIPDINWSIRELAARLGNPPAGEKLVTYLSRYAYLELERIKLESEMKRFDAKHG